MSSSSGAERVDVLAPTTRPVVSFLPSEESPFPVTYLLWLDRHGWFTVPEVLDEPDYHRTPIYDRLMEETMDRIPIDHVDPPAPLPEPACPECRNGKHGNCDGYALNEVTDDFGPCACGEEGHPDA